jgi:hypothetical protein
MLIHIYKEAAKLDTPSYRALLREHAGFDSAAAQGFTNSGFDRVISALERELFSRVAEGSVPDPRPSRYIKDEFYWRRRCGLDTSAGAKGYITTRQAHRIDELWQKILPSLTPEQRRPEYLKGIISKATGKPDVGLSPLTYPQAAQVIDALAYQLMRHTHPELEESPHA